MSDATTSVRPTKKQKELLSYIEEFISEHGYSPSYREIMNGLQYTSVATVSLHVNSLIRRGHLRKRDRSARSLEVVNLTEGASLPGQSNDEEKWMVEKVEEFLRQLEVATEVSKEKVEELQVLIRSMQVLGLHEPAAEFVPRYEELSKKVD